jgi:hypothetical protein
MMSDPNHSWWSEPMTLIFGKAAVPVQPWEAIFPDVEPRQQRPATPAEGASAAPSPLDSRQPVTLALGDPWHFYEEFRHAHQLTNLPAASIPEIAVKQGSVVGVPVLITRKPGAPREITVKATAPNGWKVISGDGKFLLPDEEIAYLRVELQSPEIPANELKGRKPDSIAVSGMAGDKVFGEVTLRVLLRSNALPQ